MLWAWDKTLAAECRGGLASAKVLASGERVGLIDAAADSCKGGASLVTTVTLCADETAPIPPGDVLDVRAYVSWGAKNARQTACVDVGRGTVVSVPASRIVIEVENRGVAANVIAVLGVGTRPGPTQPICKAPEILALAAGTLSAPFPIPKFAESVDVWVTDGVAGIVQLSSADPADVLTEDPEIDPCASFVQIRNDGGAAADFRPFFRLRI